MYEQHRIADNIEEYLGEKKNSCCFTGHRNIDDSKKPELLKRLKATISYLYSENGVNEYYAGGAVGFDTMAAVLIIDLKRIHTDMRLILELPYRGQSKKWSDNDKRIYDFILSCADEVHYASDRDPKNSHENTIFMHKRDQALVDNSLYCVAYYSGGKGGTGYTVNYAAENGLEIINLYDE